MHDAKSVVVVYHGISEAPCYASYTSDHALLLKILRVLRVTSEQRGYSVTAQVKEGKLWNLILKLLM